MPSERFALVLGYRKGAIKALKEMGIPFGVWDDRKRKPSGGAFDLVAEFPSPNDDLGSLPNKHQELNRSITHVIAAVEQQVYFASRLRRALGARISKDTVIMKCFDKWSMKKHLQAAQIPMTEFGLAPTPPDFDQIAAQYGQPFVLKLRRSSGGRGVHIIHNQNDLDEVRQRQPTRYQHYIVERLIAPADEYSVESFISRGQVIFSNVTEYYKKQYVNIVPGGIADIREPLLALNRKVLDALKIKWGMTHVEFYVTPKGILFGEVALRPPGGHIMELISEAYGFDSWQAFCSVELDLDLTLPSQEKSTAIGTIIHPGQGRVRAVRGIEELSRHPATKVFNLRLKAGDLVRHREGVGQECGYLIQSCSSREQAIQLSTGINRNLVIELQTDS